MATLNDLVATEADLKRAEAEIERLKAALARDGQRSLVMADKMDAQETENERLRAFKAAAKAVLDNFRKSEADGYRSRDRQYANEVLGKFVDEQVMPVTKEG